MSEASACNTCGARISKAAAFNNRGRCAACIRSPEVRLRNDVIGSAVAAVLMVVAAIVLYVWLETMGGSGHAVPLPLLLVSVYEALGPVGVALVPLLGATGMVGTFWVKRRQLRDLEADLPRNPEPRSSHHSGRHATRPRTTE